MHRTHGCSSNIICLIIKRVLISFLLLFQLCSNAQNINLSELDIAQFKASDHIYYQVFTDKAPTIEQLLSQFEQQFVRQADRPFSPKIDGSTYWYRLDFNNDSNKLYPLILQIDNPMIDQLELFTVINRKVINRELLGDHHQHTYSLKNSQPHFKLEFAADTVTQLYLRVKSDGSAVIPMMLHSQQSFESQIYRTFLTWGAFIGIILMMTAYNTLLYIGSRDKIYLFYIGYIVAMLVQLGIVYGFGFHLLPFEIQSWFHQKIILFIYLISTLAILFALYFLRYNIDKSQIYRFSIRFCWLLAILGLSTLFIAEYTALKISYPFQLSVYVLIGWITIPKLFNGNRWAKYYFISWLPLFTGVTITHLLLLDVIPYHYLSQNALLFSVVLEIAFISFALADRFKANEHKRIYHATHDTVTRLPNQILLTESINLQIEQQQHFTLILFEAERFSEIKPALGLIAANNLVSAIVDNVSDYFSAMDNLYVFEKNTAVKNSPQNDSKNEVRLSRISEDAFGLILKGAHEQDELKYIILTIQEAVSTPINVGGYSVSTSCSVGSVSYPQFGTNGDVVVQKALHALDIARKDDAKFAFYSDAHKAGIQQQLQLVAELQKAIDEDVLEIYHQPQIDLASQKVCGNEALVRWNHPTHGFISPEVFVVLAEDTGMINQLTEWVITRALEQHAQLIEAGFLQNISINLSAKDLTQSGLIAHIMTTIADLSLDPSSIIFELTESATSDDPVHALKTINQLHELKLKIAIDDFGTGYSSLEYLSKLPFHELKVDKSFVLEMLNSDRDKTITKTTIEMAKNLDIFVVAEGIETVEIENVLKSWQCEIGQGYLYSKPLALNAYLDWLTTDNPYM
ncbi:MAG: EAL domain-containing protein (putative c-di-GMP-specific phosphodiesterase class I) [Phenylobacterium sp.]|jgi:EAL domain-containing protein (putative c-di-GMP-specific phosphodiesterase class I)/GGDEF domain-containing protein